MLPLKILIYRLLKVMSNQWDTTFACESHYVALRNQKNSIIANLYLTGLSMEISETRRKDQVDSFKCIHKLEFRCARNFRNEIQLNLTWPILQ